MLGDADVRNYYYYYYSVARSARGPAPHDQPKQPKPPRPANTGQKAYLAKCLLVPLLVDDIRVKTGKLHKHEGI